MQVKRASFGGPRLQIEVNRFRTFACRNGKLDIGYRQLPGTASDIRNVPALELLSGPLKRKCDRKTKQMLKAINVTKEFGALKAVDNLSFEVRKGQVFGIAGPNGAGKSTVFNLITGHYPYRGTIEFEGRDTSGLPPYRLARAGISRTFQIPRVFPSLTVEKSISVGSRFGTEQGLDPSYVEEVMRFVDLSHKRHKNTGILSLLEKKKLMIGAALATKPKLLLLDEPMGGCNVREIKRLMELIRRINQELGVTIVIIEHFMKVLTELTESLLIIETGSEICCGDPVEVTNDPKVIECYLGSEHD